MPKKSLEAKVAAALAALSTTVLLVFLDLWSGTSIRMGPLYALPVLIAAWYFGPRSGVVAALVATAVWNTVLFRDLHETTMTLVRFWDICVGLMSFCTLGVAVARFKAMLLQQISLANQLQEALDQVRTLEGLLPICAWCKKVRDDEGTWQQIESYVTTHSNATWTHGICPECQARFKVEAHGSPFEGLPDHPLEAPGGGS